jgi:hypothetical protein
MVISKLRHRSNQKLQSHRLNLLSQDREEHMVQSMHLLCKVRTRLHLMAHLLTNPQMAREHRSRSTISYSGYASSNNSRPRSKTTAVIS